MSGIKNSESSEIVLDLVKAIQDNKSYLSEIDGAIGDGDHGINMNKGFSLAGESIAANHHSFSIALKTLGTVLLKEIGGSMGPLYGTFFRKMAVACMETELIDASVFRSMLQAAYSGIQQLSDAKVGDKTLVDTLDPAVKAYNSALSEGQDFAGALDRMISASWEGMMSTRDMVAKIGRSSRLGERSRGVLDAGATSSHIILSTLGMSIKERMARN